MKTTTIAVLEVLGIRLFVVALVVLLTIGTAGCQEANAPGVNHASPSITVSTQPSQLTWSGDVDDTATVYIQGGRAWTDNVTRKGVENTVATFTGTLPASDATLTLASHTGRGQVEIVQQPTRDNNYTGGVRIIDSESGRSHYEFVVTW